jgi:polysaccharide chain length determinant protein (PEP-CTERM system associated)
MHAQINELFGYLHGMWRYRWSALLIAWITAISGWLWVYSIPNKYTVKAVVNIDTTSIMRPLLKGLSVQTDPTAELNVMTRVLLSRDNLLAVIRETDMDLNANTPVEKERLVNNLANSIWLSSGGGRRHTNSGSNIYQIGYESTSPELAYKVVSTFLNTLIENTLNTGRSDTVMAQNFLDVQISDYEKRLSEAEERLAEFRKKNVGYMPDERGGYYTRLRRAQEEIEATKSSLRLAKQRYNELRQQLSGKASPDDSRSDLAKARRLRKYTEQLDDLLLRFTEDHPDVQALRSKIAALKSGQIESLEVGGGVMDESSLVYQELKVQESQARIDVGRQQILLAEQQGSLEKMQRSIDIMTQVEADLQKLNRDYEITKERYLQLVERRESARMAQKVEQNSSEITFQVVDPPVIPVLPSGPDRPILLATVLLAALGAGAAWSVLMFLLFPTFVDYKQLRKAIDLPVLGAVGLQMTLQQKQYRTLKLRTFLVALLVLLGFFGGVLWYQEPGSMLVRSIINDIGISI